MTQGGAVATAELADLTVDQCVLVEERLQGFATLAGQDRVIKEITAWLHELPGS